MNVKIIFPWSFPWKLGMPLQPIHHQTPPSPTLFHRKGFANRSLETSKKVGTIKGNGLGPGERCETKWRIFKFPKKNGRIFGWRGLEPRNLKMFGFVRAGHVLWDFKTVSPSALMVSFSVWTSFSRSSKSTLSISSCCRAPDPRLVRGLYHWAQTSSVSWERAICLQKAEGEGGRRGRRTTFGQVSLPSTCRSPPSPSHSLDSLV